MINSYQEKQQLLPKKEVDTVRLGSIVSSTDAGYTVLFDGEDESSGKAYPVIVAGVLSVGDRVACIAAKGSWIVLGRISTVASGESGGGSSGGGTSGGTPATGYLPTSGGTMTGALVAQANTNYTTRQVRNVIYLPEGATLPATQNGDLVLFYKD